MGMPRLVMKFGGSSIADAGKISRAAALIVAPALSEQPVVVVSALEGVTDSLIAMADAAADGRPYGDMLDALSRMHKNTAAELGLDPHLLDRDISDLARRLELVHGAGAGRKDLKDAVMAFGEVASARLFAGALDRLGIGADARMSYEIGFITDSNHGSANVLAGAYGAIRESLANQRRIQVVTGFIGMDGKGAITTTGRGGSSYTATVIGAAISAREVQIWTDVDGVMTGNPKINSGATRIGSMTYEAAQRLAAAGAKVLPPKSLGPAVEYGVAIRVLNTFNPECEGTLISREAGRMGLAKGVAGVRGLERREGGAGRKKEHQA